MELNELAPSVKVPWWRAQSGWGWWLQAGIAVALELALLGIFLPLAGAA